VNTLQHLLNNILSFLYYSNQGQIFALSFFFIFTFRIFFERHDRALFFVVLGTFLYLPIITHMLFGGDEVFIISKIRHITYLIQFNKFFPLSFIGGAIGFYLAEFFVKSGYISRNIKKTLSSIILIVFFGSWLYLLIRYW
jgi:hypothetical protein